MIQSAETPSSRAGEQKNVDRFLAFSLCTEEYAVGLSSVKEVIAMTEITPVPFSHAHFRGIINLRGQLVSVVDLRLKFKMPKAELGPETAILILDLGGFAAGVIVDSVNSVLALTAEQIQEPPRTDTTVKTEFIRGVAQRGKKLVFLLDIARTMDPAELAHMKGQAQTAQKKAA